MATPDSAVTDGGWRWLYLIGGVAAIITVLLALLDIGMSMVMPGGDMEPGTMNAVGWFAVFEADAFRAMRDLGILNIINQVLGIPVLLALYALHRSRNEALSLLALVVALFGSAIYIANNTVLPLYALSSQYAAATSEAQQVALAAAGEALLARGADFTPGTIVGFILPLAGNMVMALVLLRGEVFGKAAGIFGLVAFISLGIFTVMVTFWPSTFQVAMLIALPGGLCSIAWNILIARKLFQLSRA